MLRSVNLALKLVRNSQNAHPPLYSAYLQSLTTRNLNWALASYRLFSKERAGKAVKPGEALVIDGAPHKVTKITQGKRGKGGSYVRANMKNLITGVSTEKTFLVDESVEYADLEKSTASYSWNDGDTYHFLDASTFEAVEIAAADIPDKDFLLEGQEVTLQRFKNAIIGVQLSKISEYVVASVNPLKTSANYQSCTLDCGAEVMVPMFITEGTRIRVNVSDREYVERCT